jgi:cystathionine beta-lyase/cystathionine gamma-synthase
MRAGTGSVLYRGRWYRIARITAQTNLDPEDISTCLVDDLADDPSGAPMAAPVVHTSLFAFPDLQSLVAGLAAEDRCHVYTRGQNPTVETVERKLARLERGEACKCFGSGMAAISAVMQSLLEAGDHVVFVNHVYGPTLQLAGHLRRFQVAHDVVLDGRPDSVAAVLRPNTRLLWIESPGTMLFRVVDIAALVEMARARGITTCLDNSWATPLLQKPLTMGIDIVVHSATKYLAGHSDVMAGAVVTSAALMRDIFRRGFMLGGGLLSPHEAWLLLRGLRTLPVRLRQQQDDALTVAAFLRTHPAVSEVFHPAFHAAPALLARQQRGCSGVFSAALKRGDFARVAGVVNRLRRFRIGVSWGGVESIVISPNRGDNGPALEAQGIPQGLIRLSIGLEGADVLVADLAEALEGTRE